MDGQAADLAIRFADHHHGPAGILLVGNPRKQRGGRLIGFPRLVHGQHQVAVVGNVGIYRSALSSAPTTAIGRLTASRSGPGISVDLFPA
jgi:hypothetical protein